MTYTPLREFPAVLREPDFIELLKGSVRGLDLEWDEQEHPTIVGLSDDERVVSVYWDRGRKHVEELAANPDITLVGHNCIQADKVALERVGINIPLERWDDTIIKFYLTNAHLCKVSKKSSLDTGEGERKGRGFMNLGTTLSLYTNLPQHKYCREASHMDYEVRSLGTFYKSGKKKGQEKTKKFKVTAIDSPCSGPCPVHDPLGYNGLDTLGPVLANPALDYHMKMRGVEGLYKMHCQLAEVLAKMRERGVPVGLKYVDTLRSEFGVEKAAAKEGLAFNPESPKQIHSHFALFNLKDAREETIRKKIEEMERRARLSSLQESRLEELRSLLDYKELGDGPDRWYGEKFLTRVNPELGFVHPGLNFFTSSGRLMCSNPNMQNVAKRRIDRKTGEKIGKKVRRAVVAPEGYYLLRCDYKNAENRNYLYLAGYKDIPNEDFHTWMQREMGITESDPFALVMGGAREGAKSIVHATDYLEGLKLEPKITPKLLREEERGIRVIYRDWKIFGKFVTFTGINLARRAFGRASDENRRRALGGQQKYFGRFERLRQLYMRIGRQVEVERCVRPPHGYYLMSFGHQEERIKTAASVWGSQPVAHFTKLALLRAEQHPRLIPILQVHDELIFLVSVEYNPRQAKKWAEEVMVFTTEEMPGFSIPVDVSYGENWADQTEIV